jgi:hypothetical protein
MPATSGTKNHQGTQLPIAPVTPSPPSPHASPAGSKFLYGQPVLVTGDGANNAYTGLRGTFSAYSGNNVSIKLADGSTINVLAQNVSPG